MYCRHCGKELPNGSRFCDSCGSKVDAQSADTSASTKSSSKTAVIVILTLCLVLAAAVVLLIRFFPSAHSPEFGSSQNQALTPSTVETSAPSPSSSSLKPRTTPVENGEIILDTIYDCICPFTVSVTGSDAYYIYLQYVDAPKSSIARHTDYDPSVKSDLRTFMAARNDETINDISLYVAPGCSASIDVPVGIYRLFYACGEDWYGYERLFGPGTVYYAADSLLSFYVDEDEAVGVTVELWSQIGGNMETHQIEKTDAPF